MNWTWDIRSRDGASNGLEFARCTTAAPTSRVLVHAAPERMAVEARSDDGGVVAAGDLDRDGSYTPMTLVEIVDGRLRRTDVWPSEEHHGLIVLLAGGEAGTLRQWQHGDDRSWWRWSVEFSNSVDGAPAGGDRGTGDGMDVAGSDPYEHARRTQERVEELLDHVRADVLQVADPRAEALFETAAEVLGGLAKALADFDAGDEPAWQPEPHRDG